MSGHENQSMIVDEILGKIENGFFVECNANDGEVNSNSLFFEMKRNWTGILIEPNQAAIAELVKKNRKVNKKTIYIEDCDMYFLRCTCFGVKCFKCNEIHFPWPFEVNNILSKNFRKPSLAYLYIIFQCLVLPILFLLFCV
jgi:hypothetical protein